MRPIALVENIANFHLCLACYIGDIIGYLRTEKNRYDSKNQKI